MVLASGLDWFIYQFYVLGPLLFFFFMCGRLIGPSLCCEWIFIHLILFHFVT